MTYAIEKQREALSLLLAQLRQNMDVDADLASDIAESETDLFEVIDKALAQRAVDTATVAGLDDLIGHLMARKDRIEKRADDTRQAMLSVLQVLDAKKLERPAGTISRRALPQSLIINNDADIPATYWKAGAPKLDRKTLLDDLKNGASVSGATLSNGGETVQVRV